MLPDWTIGTSPEANLVNSILEKAASGLREEEHPIVYSDRGVIISGQAGEIK